MRSLILLAVTSLTLTLFLTPWVRDLFRRLGVVDLPDATRKLHQHPMPRVGGIAIVLSFALSAGFAELLQPSSPLIAKLAPAAAVVFFIGLIDDLVRLKPWQKLVGQIAAAVIAYASGVCVLGVGALPVNVFWGLLLTVCWLVVCCNAINLMDGADGLATGVSLIAAVTMLAAAAMQRNLPLTFAIVPLAGCLVGFLRYNFHPASVFMGDCGSLFIGFVLGCYAVLWSEKATNPLDMAAPLMALTLPLLDTGLSITRRFLRNEPILKGDRGHIHHRLLNRGYSPSQVVWILYGASAIAGALALCLANAYLAVPALLLFGFLVWLSLQRLGYVEFGSAVQLLVRGSFRRVLRSQIALKEFETKLALASTADEFWQVMQGSCREFGVHQIHMRLGGRTYFKGTEPCGPRNTWCVTLSLAGGDFLEITHQVQVGQREEVFTAFADVLKSTLEVRGKALLMEAASRAASAGS